MILVDSSVWIDYFNGRSTAEADRLDRLLDSQELTVADLVLVEVLQGFNEERHYRTALRLFEPLTLVEIGGRETALAAAAHFRALRGRGVTIRKTIDTLIATWCIRHDVPLLFSDRDFDPFVEYLGLRSALA